MQNLYKKGGILHFPPFEVVKIATIRIIPLLSAWPRTP